MPISGTSPSSNGCGSGGFIKIDFSKYDNFSGFNSCCNKHDICYNTCGSTKLACDSVFNDCLNAAVKASNANFFTNLSIFTFIFNLKVLILENF